MLPLLAEEGNLKLNQLITYYVHELDKLETIPARLLVFAGYELIDEEHYFFFYKVTSGVWYDKLRAVDRVLRATVALVPMQGYNRLLVQYIEAIPESEFEKNHFPETTGLSAMLG